jgi:hypothetical protein
MTGDLVAQKTNPPDVATWAGGLTDAQLSCRDYGHYWRPFTASWEQESRSYHRVLRCGRCKTERHQLLDSRGHPVRGHYDYAPGYLAPAGTGRLVGEDRDVLRLESVVRLMGADDVAAARRRQRRAS